MMQKRMPLLLLLLLLGVAQVLASDDYKEYAEGVRKEIWSWNRPEFDVKAVPEKYDKESAVILAQRREIEISSRGKVRFGFNSFDVNRRVSYTDIQRKRIKINDKVALEYYSDLSFDQEDHERFNKKDERIVVGVKVIKPNGQTIVVDVDKEAVAVKEGKGKKEKESYKKVAIPGLQVGDIIDYFVLYSRQVDNENVSEIDFVLAEKYPVMNYSLHCDVSPNLTTQYCSVNKAPDFSVSTNEDGDHLLDISIKNMAKLIVPVLSSPDREVPICKLLVKDRKIDTQTGRKAGLFKGCDLPLLLEEKSTELNNEYRNFESLGFGAVLKAAKKNLKKYIKSHPNATKREITDYIYEAYICEAESWTYYDTPILQFPDICLYYINLLMNDYVDSKYMFVTDRFSSRPSDILSTSDLCPIISINKGEYFYTLSASGNTCEKNMFYSNEGEPMFPLNGDVKDLYSVTEKGTATLPFSTAEQNCLNRTANVSFNPDELTQVNVKLDSRYSGFSGLYVREKLFDGFRYADDQRSYLGLEGSYLDFMKQKSKKKYIEDYIEQRKQFEKDYPEKVKSVLEDIYEGLTVKNIANFNMSRTGLLPNQTGEAYTVDFSLDGIVKNAGRNILLDVGKLACNLIELSQDDRNRTFDVYYNNAFINNETINITLPEGYVVNDVNDICMKQVTSNLSFSVTAKLNGNVLTVSSQYKLLKPVISVSDWQNELKVYDAKNSFYKKSVLLRKK